MPEWIGGQDWWRWVWGPLLAAGLLWFSSVWKTKTDGRGTLDARLDGRLDRLVASQGTELDRATKENDRLRVVLREARDERDRAEEALDRWRQFARNLHPLARRFRHDLSNCRQMFQREAAAKSVSWLDEPPVPDLPAE